MLLFELLTEASTPAHRLQKLIYDNHSSYNDLLEMAKKLVAFTHPSNTSMQIAEEILTTCNNLTSTSAIDNININLILSELERLILEYINECNLFI